MKSGFQTPWKGSTTRRPQKLTKSLHSPHDPGAVVLYEPKELKYVLFVYHKLTTVSKVHVVVDPVLAWYLNFLMFDG
jgi:hypothetical protein